MSTHTSFLRKNLQMVAVTVMAVVGSFSLGVQTAGDVQPVSLIQAGSVEAAADMDGNAVVDIQDAIAILEIAQGYEVPTPAQLRADPNQDGLLTVDDALLILSSL